MSTFVKAVDNQEARTENDMKARASTANANVDLFFKIGASRGKDIVPDFISAFVENKDLALRIAQWTRDVRGGAGERKLFVNILSYLNKTDVESAIKLVNKVPELGRWKDLIEADLTGGVKEHAYNLIKAGLDSGNGLTAKWMPRIGVKAIEMRKYFGWTPKFYRKRLVELTKVVESQMCAKEWDNIEFSKVPSLAHARYKTAFYRNTEKYAEYVNSLVRGDAGVKVNAGAVYPYDVIKGVTYAGYNATENALVNEQWKALENFVGDANILPMVDVSGSMGCQVGGSKSLSCMDVAVSLGLYLSEKNTGKFRDIFLTFSQRPELLHLKGDIVDRMQQMKRANWDMNTDLHKSINMVLDVAIKGKVPQEEMPEMLVILSDMQFDQCTRFDDSAMEMVTRKYADAGYSMPKIVFWNLRATDNVPVKHNANGVALVSGFSPSIMKAVLNADTEQFTPYNIMLKTIMDDRYKL